jgi:hypothetical protein
MKKKPHRLLIGVVDFTTRIKGCIATCPISGTKHGSWLDMAESELAVLTTQCLSRRIPNKQTLEREAPLGSTIATNITLKPIGNSRRTTPASSLKGCTPHCE